jgi:diguanylate cyclase (GGDEF)-like protein/PAS domain S-box-containing protein
VPGVGHGDDAGVGGALLDDACDLVDVAVVGGSDEGEERRAQLAEAVERRRLERLHEGGVAGEEAMVVVQHPADQLARLDVARAERGVGEPGVDEPLHVALRELAEDRDDALLVAAGEGEPADAGADHHDALDGGGMLDGEVDGGAGAEGAADERHPLHAEVAEERRHVVGRRVGTDRDFGAADASGVEADDPELGGKRMHFGDPHPGVHPPGVEEEERLALAGNFEVEAVDRATLDGDHGGRICESRARLELHLHSSQSLTIVTIQPEHSLHVAGASLPRLTPGETARRRRQQAAIAELAQAALTGVDIDMLVGQTCALIEATLETSYCSIVEHCGGEWRLRFGIGSDASFAACDDGSPHHRQLLLFALALQQPVVFGAANISADPRINGVHFGAAHAVSAGVSLVIRGRDATAWGVLTAYTNQEKGFADDEVEFLRSVSDLTGAVIVNAQIEEARRSAERDRVATEQRYRALVENSSDGVALIDRDGKFVYAGPSTTRVLGYSERELVGRNFAELVHPDDATFATKRMRELIEVDESEADGEVRLLHKDGSWRWIEGVYKNLLRNQSVGALVMNYRDVTERKLAEQQLEQLAYRDSLTNLPNRFLFHDRLEHALDQSRRRNRGLGLMYIDLDRFKVVNDTLGHTMGDKLLQIVGRRLREMLRADDTIARLGGDEFAVILPDLERAEDAGIIGRKLLQTLRSPITIDGHELHTSGSIGISMFPGDGEDADTLIKHADAALYRAKDLGRNSVQLFATSMNARYTERLELEMALHRAVDRNEFALHYQPICNRADGTIRAFEALVRWRRPDYGLVSPAQFIHLAEETRLIIPIGEWVLHQACAQLRAWRDAGLPHFHIAVNLSAHQITQPGFIHIVHDAVKSNGLEPDDLELEVTESAALQNLEWTLSVLDQLRSLGVRIAVDDFGTGQSSLVYLKRLPLNTLKIDREFLRDVRDANDVAILASIIHLGHSLGLYVIAEGIETLADRQLLEEQGCDGMQGYLFSQPIAADAVAGFLERFRYSEVVP